MNNVKGLFFGLRKMSCLAVAMMLTLACPGLWSQRKESEEHSIDGLTRAIGEHDQDRIEEILQTHIDLNDRDRNGSTPLLEAIARHLASVAKRLVLIGADPNFAGNGDEYPLAQASFYCDIGLAKCLFEHGALIDAADRGGNTALMHAASNCSDGKMVKLLLRFGANPNMRSKDGETPLIVAAFNGDERAVKELLKAGADPTAITEDGESALSKACDRQAGRKKEHDRICLLLRDPQLQK